MERAAILQLAEVEHVIEAVVFVGDDIEDDVTVVLESVYVVVDDHRSCVVLRLDVFASLSVYQVDQGLSKR